MADLTQGAPLPNITTTKTETTNAPGWYDQYLKDIAGAGSKAMAMTPDQLVAGFSPLQESAMQGVTAAGQAGQGAIRAGETAASSVAAGLTPQRIQNLMSPYTTNVVNEMGRVSGLDTQRNVIPGLKAAFVGTGGLGSRRYAGATGQTMADIQSNLLGQQTGALQKGYSDALNAAIQEMNAQRQAADTLGALGTAEQTAALKGNQAQYQMGTEQQKLAQSKINAPLTAATNAANLFTNLKIPTSVGTIENKPIPGAYANSPLSQIAGLASLFASTSGGKSAVTGIQDFVKGLTGGKGINLSLGNLGGITPGTTSSGATEIANTAQPGDAGYGWKYFSDGTSISPEGDYYSDGKLVWSPGEFDVLENPLPPADYTSPEGYWDYDPDTGMPVFVENP